MKTTDAHPTPTCRRCGAEYSEPEYEGQSPHPVCDCWPHAAVPDAALAELTSVVLVGEDNPYGSDPRNALVCWPERCAGDRMRRLVCGLPEAEYLAMWRLNLCDDRWSVRAARNRARHLVHHGVPGAPTAVLRVLVLLGRKVAGAVEDVTGVRVEPFEHARLTGAGVSLLSLPHPSGLSRAWNAPGAFERARAALREVVPGVAWGSAAT